MFPYNIQEDHYQLKYWLLNLCTCAEFTKSLKNYLRFAYGEGEGGESCSAFENSGGQQAWGKIEGPLADTRCGSSLH